MRQLRQLRDHRTGVFDRHGNQHQAGVGEQGRGLLPVVFLEDAHAVAGAHEERSQAAAKGTAAADDDHGATAITRRREVGSLRAVTLAHDPAQDVLDQIRIDAGRCGFLTAGGEQLCFAFGDIQGQTVARFQCADFGREADAPRQHGHQLVIGLVDSGAQLGERGGHGWLACKQRIGQALCEAPGRQAIGFAGCGEVPQCPSPCSDGPACKAYFSLASLRNASALSVCSQEKVVNDEPSASVTRSGVRPKWP